jgi:hypothetical protein
MVVVCFLLASPLMGQHHFSDWAEPVNLGPFVNSAFNESGPALSKDGLSLYLSSNRPGHIGGGDLWVSQRNSVDEPWGLPINLGPIVNSTDGEQHPELSRDGHWLFFTSGRLGGFGESDIWVSYRENIRDDFDWQPPVNAGPGINSAGIEQEASFFENDDVGLSQLIFSRLVAGRGGEIFVSDLQPDGTFGAAALVPELSSAATEAGPSVRFDGLEIFFSSTRFPSFGGNDLWTATRQTVLDPWSTPTNLGPLVNGVSLEVVPHIASDRETLYFMSNRPGGFGAFDLYVTTRTKHNASNSARFP